MKFSSTWMLLATLAIAVPAGGVSELVISAHGAGVSPVHNARFAAPDASVSFGPITLVPTGHPEDATEGLRISFVGTELVGPYPRSFLLIFVPPIRQTYAAGDYDGVTDYLLRPDNDIGAIPVGRPGMDITSADFFGFGLHSAHYSVLDVAYDGAGHIVRFSADFTATRSDGTPVTGSVRLRAGDDECVGAADGAPCDDLDACSATSSCFGGQCAGGDAVVCDTTPQVCIDPAVCMPSSGLCLPRTPKPAYAHCDDGNACTGTTGFDICDPFGVCQGGIAQRCDDGNPCTLDRCDPTVGCVSAPAPGLCGNPGAPDNYLFVASPPGDPVGDGQSVTILPAPGVSAVIAQPNRISMQSWNDSHSDYWYVALAAAPGASLVPGTYANTHSSFLTPVPGRPFLDVYHAATHVSCDAGTGSFTLREIAVSSVLGAFTLDALVADIDYRCTPEAPALSMAIRYHAGEAFCRRSPDGTPCDDANACTADDTCHAGVCVGTATTACGVQRDCVEGPLCNPRTGECLAPVPTSEGPSCTDASACVATGTCRQGVCTPEHDPCDDFDVCTTDTCDAGQCVHGAIDGSCWALRGSTTFFATALGHTCQCTQRIPLLPLALYDDGRFAIPGGPSACPVEEVVIPAETGTWRRKGRQQLILSTTNLPELLAVAEQCANLDVPPITRYRRSVHLAANGRRLRGVHVETTRTRTLPRVAVTAVTRFRGIPTAHGVAEAGTTDTARCQRQLVSCLRAKVGD